MISGISRQSSGHSLTVHYNRIDMSRQESGFLASPHAQSFATNQKAPTELTVSALFYERTPEQLIQLRFKTFRSTIRR